MHFQCDMNVLPHCCGFFEAGYFKVSVSKNTYADIDVESLDEFFRRCLNRAGGRPIIFNFFREAIREDDDEDSAPIPGEFKDEYDCDEIRQAVINHKNVIDLGKHINPGSGNEIHSLVIKDYK